MGSCTQATGKPIPLKSCPFKGMLSSCALRRRPQVQGRSGKRPILQSHVPQDSSTGFPSLLSIPSVKVVQIPRSSEPDDIGMIY